MESIVVFEGISGGRYYADEIIRRGYAPVVIFPKIPSRPVYEALRAPAKAYWEKLGATVIAPEDSSEAAMLEILRRINPAAVVAGSEIGVPWCDFAAKALGLPGNDPATSLWRRSKFAMQSRLAECGVPAIRSRRCSTVEACLETAREWGAWPVVVKPLSGAGSDGVHFCPDEASLLEKCREVFAGRDIFGYRNTEILLQEFLRGTEYIVNTASCRGRHAVTDIWRYDKIPLGDLGNPYNYAALVMQPTEIEKPIVDYVMAVLDALGFEYGPSHTEIMLTAQGPRLIETGARPMGGFFPPAELRDSLGHEIVDIALDTLLAPEAFEAFRREPYAPVKPALLKIVVSSAAYKVGDIHYEALLMEAPAARCWEFDFVRAHGGTAVSVDLESAAGEVYLSDENPEKVWLAYESLRRLESQAERWLFAPAGEALRMRTPVLHGTGAVPYAESVVLPWPDVIRHVGKYSRETPAGTTLLVEAGSQTEEEALVFRSLLGLFGWKATEYDAYRKL